MAPAQPYAGVLAVGATVTCTCWIDPVFALEVDTDGDCAAGDAPCPAWGTLPRGPYRLVSSAAINGPSERPTERALVADLDGDGDVDMVDVAIWQGLWRGD